ncbi:MAG: amino acid permease [Acholeplasmataceae bacterium]|nr:amino acid permease [Acholeplasmataceae bacterium]
MSSLKKEIGLFGGISILAGIMIGSGIFVFGSLVLVHVGYAIGLSLLAWLIGGIITLFSGLTYAELGTMFPETGGYYVYLKKAYGSKVAFLSGITSFVLSSSGSIALLALVFAEILSYVVPISGYVKLIAALLIIMLSIVNYFGVKAGAIVQKVFLVAKIIPIIAIIFIGLFMGTESVNLTFTPIGDVSFFKVLSMVGFGVVATLWAYEGWTNLNTVAGEMKNVKRDLPRALVISISAVTIIYVLFIFALYRIIPYASLLASDASSNFTIGAMMTLFGETGMLIVFVSVMISIFGALNGSVMVFPRVYYAMAEDKTFFKSFSKLDKKYNTPFVSIIGSGLMAILLLVFNIRELLTFVVFGGLIFNTLIFYSVFMFRKKNPELERPYKVWGYPYVPAIAIIGMVGLLIATLIESLLPSLIGFAVLIVGYFVYDLVFKKKEIK